MRFVFPTAQLEVKALGRALTAIRLRVMQLDTPGAMGLISCVERLEYEATRRVFVGMA